MTAIDMRGVFFLMALVACAVLARSMFAADERADITVKVSSDRGPVNRRVLGNNALAYLHAKEQYSRRGSGMWDPERQAPVAPMMKLAREAGVTMLRWPGGCGVHRYNWKLTVGPVKDRPRQPFGLPEFLRCCAEIGAEPILTIAAYWGEAEDFADLVEYLNAPVGKNPNGGRDWAAVRAADGHPEPYGVVWFEYGNETYHGPHIGRRDHGPALTPEEYSRRYIRYRETMKAVDPKIKLGAVLRNETRPELSEWSRVVIEKTGHAADFYIHHAYLPGYFRNDGKPPAEELYALAFAAARQFHHYYKVLNDFIKKTAGRAVPLAITEFNGSFVQSKPVPYRLTLGTAVQVADLLQVLLDPRHNIDNAEYWQFCNEYWGMVRGYEEPYLLRPAYYVFKMYSRYLGDRLLEADVRCGGYDCKGGLRILPAHGEPTEFKLIGAPKPLGAHWRISKVEGASAEVDEDGVLCVEITASGDFNYYHASLQLPARPLWGYRVTAEVRTSGLERRGAQIQVGDARGWTVTRSASMSEQVNGADWKTVSCDYVTLPDAKAIAVTARRLERSPEAGRFWIRRVTVQEFQPFNPGRVPYLSAVASRRADGAVSVIIVNRNLRQKIAVKITGTNARTARAEVLAGPAVDATNEKDPNACVVRPLAAEVSDGVVLVDLPPHSLTAVVIHQ